MEKCCVFTLELYPTLGSPLSKQYTSHFVILGTTDSWKIWNRIFLNSTLDLYNFIHFSSRFIESRAFISNLLRPWCPQFGHADTRSEKQIGVREEGNVLQLVLRERDLTVFA